MRRWIVATLAAAELLVTCAIFACSLQLSHRIARSHTLGNVAAAVVRSTRTLAASTLHLAASTRRLAQDGVHVRITIDNA